MAVRVPRNLLWALGLQLDLIEMCLKRHIQCIKDELQFLAVNELFLLYDAFQELVTHISVPGNVLQQVGVREKIHQPDGHNRKNDLRPHLRELSASVRDEKVQTQYLLDL
jgi:hypothetical protein